MSDSTRVIPALSAYERLLCVTQTLAYLLAAFPLRTVFRAKRQFHSSLSQTKRGLLIVSNHQSEADPFLILACLPFQSFIKLLPIYFPTTEAVFTSKKYNPRWFPLIWLLGCFSLGKDTAERMRSMLYIRQLLNQERTVVIFPEGKINRDINLDDFKRGADFFLTHSTGALFVRLSGVSKTARALGQTTCTVSFSHIITPTQIEQNQLTISEIINNL